MFDEVIDVKEDSIYQYDEELLNILLKDNSSKKNIIWATDIYIKKGFGFNFYDHITIEKITGGMKNVIKPRTKKSKEEQVIRIRDKAEVFTPSWMCNLQNNLVDESWFGYKNIFNVTTQETWQTTIDKVKFINNKTWKDYVIENRMEISCGEAPYLVSRYDTVTGNVIPVDNRIGLLDRKLRIINENIEKEAEWVEWCIKAYKSTYGFEWQGDSLLIARENLLYTFVDNYKYKFDKKIDINILKEIANVISWNVWQMDGIKFVIPNSCKNEKIVNMTLFGAEIIETECEGCKKNNPQKHNGHYCYIMNWETKKKIKFASLLNKK